MRPDDRRPPAPPRTAGGGDGGGGPHRARRRAGAAAARGDRPAPRALPVAGGALRPRGPHPRAGRAAPGLAGRDGQEPALARLGNGSATGSIRRGVGPELGPLAVAGAFKVPAVSVPPALLDATTSAAMRFAAIGPAVARVGRHTRRGSPPIHDDDTMVEGRHGPRRRRRDGLGGRMARPRERPGGSAPAARKTGDAARGADAGGDTRSSPEARASPWSSGDRRGRPGRGRLLPRRGPTTIITIVPEGRARQEGATSSPSWTRRRSRTSSSTSGSRPGAPRPTTRTPSSPARSPRSPSRNTSRGSSGRTGRPDAGDRRPRATIRKIEKRLERTRQASQRSSEALGQRRGQDVRPTSSPRSTSSDRIEEAELSLDRERRALAQAEGRRNVLEKYTSRRRSRSWRAEIEKARCRRAGQGRRPGSWRRARRRSSRSRSPIARSIAPIDGMVVHANDPAPRLRPRPAQIEEGATVRERQMVFTHRRPRRPDADQPQGARGDGSTSSRRG